MSAAAAHKLRVIRVLLVDDHPIVRQGLAQLINQEKDMEVCGEAMDHAGGLAAIKEHNPDLAVVDISLKGSDGLALLKDIREETPHLPVLVLSMHDEGMYAERALRAGARGYIMKQEALEQVLQAIRRILVGELFLSEKMRTRLLFAVTKGGNDLETSPISRLGDRELTVFQLAGEGLSTREIAKRMGLSVKTVESYYARIKEKLNLKSATELVQSATLWVASESCG